jgi:alkylhydroperoxidase family enzyme
VSGQFINPDQQPDLAAVNGTAKDDAGVEHGALLVAFTEAVMSRDAGEIVRQRKALRAALSDDAFVDTAAVIGAFNVVDRIADSTGIPLDGMLQEMSQGIPKELELTRFASAANTPAAS